MKKTKKIIVGACILALTGFSSASFAQQTTTPQAPSQENQAPSQGNKVDPTQSQDFSDAELKQFVQAGSKAAAVQQENEKAMMAVVEESKLSVEKFNELATAHQQQKLNEVKATDEEKAAFTKAAQRIMEMQPKVEQNMKQAIEGEGMSMEKFEQIMMAYQQNPALQAKIQKILEQQP